MTILFSADFNLLLHRNLQLKKGFRYKKEVIYYLESHTG